MEETGSEMGYQRPDSGDANLMERDNELSSAAWTKKYDLG